MLMITVFTGRSCTHNFLLNTDGSYTLDLYATITIIIKDICVHFTFQFLCDNNTLYLFHNMQSSCAMNRSNSCILNDVCVRE